MRMSNPAPAVFPRISNQDHMLANIPIRKGTIVANNCFGPQYDTKYFPDPFVFRPERW